MWCGGSVLLAVLMVVCSIASSDCVTVEQRATSQRHVRQTSYWLDIMVMIDRATYQSWYGRTQTSLSRDQRENETLVNMKKYFTLVLKEVSALYSQLGDGYRLNFRPVGFYFESETKNQWLASYPSGQVNAEQTLAKMTTWLQLFASQSQYDHALLFTGKDLATDDEGHTAGRGSVGSMCKKPGHESVSVIEDKGAFQSVFTVAHELGHSLNASHDGRSNGCSGSDRYIMATNTSTGDDNTRNRWFFSPCSKSEITDFLNSMSGSELDGCLRTRLPQHSDVPDVTGIVPGQLYSSDSQCQHLYGSQSSYCFFGNLTTICTDMPCKDPTKLLSLSCNVHIAATGTSCGNKKWCQSGQCVESPDAPVVAESCVKDTTTTVNGQSCQRMALTQTSLCYDEEVFSKCCQSCGAADSGVRGCPFGNRKGSCTSNVCNKINYNGDIFDEDCCETCNFNSETWTCQDVATIDGRSCAIAVELNGIQGCYNLTLAFHCCATCQTLRDRYGKKDCEYGDRLLRGCPTYVQRQCDTSLCCWTCSEDTRDTGTMHLSPLLPSLLTLASVTYLFIEHWCL